MKPSILLRTKFLTPRPPADYLPRPHLVAWLENHLNRRLILLSAPPGYGKTTLLADFLAASSRPVAWYQLDAVDSDPTVFLTYFIESLRVMRNKPPAFTRIVGQTAQALLNSAENTISPQQVLTVLLNELADTLDDSCLVILEDYHFIASPVVHQLVDFLLENAPPVLSLLISTRADPPLVLARLRARGMLAELRAPDLRFSESEVYAWMERNIPGLTSESASLLSEKTEGWAAALQMVRSSLSGQDSESASRLIAGLSGSHRFIFEYLAEEVFQRQSAERQAFLLQTSILEQMDTAACEALPGISSAQSALEQLERENLFVTSLDSQRRWYRYHHLFRDFLLSKLRREQPQHIPALEQAVGGHFERQGELEAALLHYIEARDYESSARVLKIFAPDFIERGRVKVLHRYLNALPIETLRAHPDLLLHDGNVHHRLGEAGAAITAYEDARLAFSARNDLSGTSRALTRLAEVNRAQGNYRQAETLASQALSNALKSDHAARAEALMALAKSTGFLMGMNQGRDLAEQAVEEARLAGDALSLLARANFVQSLGQICWWHGDPQAAVRYCREALQLAPEEFSPLVAQAYISLVTPHLYWCEFEKALHYAEHALEIAQQLHLSELLPSAYMALGNVLTRLGETTRAESALRQALEISQRQGLSAYEQIMAAGYLAYNLYGQGRVDEARQIAESALWAYTGNPDTYEAYVCRSVLADVAMESNQIDLAWQLYDSLVEVGERRQFRIPLSLVYFGLAYIHLERGEREKGLGFARQSLDLMEPSGAVQLYLDQGERARVVCEALAASGIKSTFLQRVLEKLPRVDKPAPVTVTDGRAIVIRCLGNFRVAVAGQEVQQERWVSTKARDLLAYFVTFRGERIPVERVFDALWPEGGARGRTAFHTALSRLRNALRTGEQSTQFILVEVGEYWLDAARFNVDIDAFNTALSKARNTSGEEAAHWYEQVVGLYGGEYLNNLYYDWLMPERRRLGRDYLVALRDLSSFHLLAGRPQESLELVQRSLQIDPLQEEMHGQAMRCLAALGDRTGIIRQYRQLEMILREELNIEPEISTKLLYRDLIGQGSPS